MGLDYLNGNEGMDVRYILSTNLVIWSGDVDIGIR